jgi:hypothetical protein
MASSDSKSTSKSGYPFLLVLLTRITGKVPIKRSLPAENAQFPEIDLFFAAFWIFLVAAIKDG